MTSIVKKGTPNRKKVKRVTINVLFMETFLSVSCALFHYQCTSIAMRIQSGALPIFDVGATPHASGAQRVQVLFISHGWEPALGDYCGSQPKKKPAG
jgi:hypothetical protein